MKIKVATFTRLKFKDLSWCQLCCQQRLTQQVGLCKTKLHGFSTVVTYRNGATVVWTTQVLDPRAVRNKAMAICATHSIPCQKLANFLSLLWYQQFNRRSCGRMKYKKINLKYKSDQFYIILHWAQGKAWCKNAVKVTWYKTNSMIAGSSHYLYHPSDCMCAKPWAQIQPSLIVAPKAPQGGKHWANSHQGDIIG